LGFDFTGIHEQSDADLLLRFVRLEQLLQAMLARTTADSRDADLAALVRSASQVGLRNRIIDFIDASSRPNTRQ
jgi:hypothetical protein